MLRTDGCTHGRTHARTHGQLENSIPTTKFAGGIKFAGGKISVFQVMGLKIVGPYIFFLEKIIILCILKGKRPFKMHKVIYFFPENLKKILGFTRKFRETLVRLPPQKQSDLDLRCLSTAVLFGRQVVFEILGSFSQTGLSKDCRF